MRDRHRTRLLLGLLLLTSFTLITLDYRAGAGSPLSPLRGLTSAIFGPIEGAAAAIVRPVRNAVDSLGHLGSYQHQIDSLKKDNTDLRAQLHTSELDRQRARELDKLLGLAGRGQYRFVPARVIGYGPALGFEFTATIDAGSKDGLKPDMTVVNGDGLVGRTKSVGPNTSTVLLAIDPASSVFVRLESTVQIGHVDGHGHQPLTVQLLSGNAEVKKGERLVTLGSQGDKPYVPEVPVGTVTSVRSTPGSLTRSAVVEPFVDFGALDLVGVVTEPPRSVKRDSVLPPRPTPSPSPTRAPAPAPGASTPPATAPTRPSGTPSPGG